MSTSLSPLDSSKLVIKLYIDDAGPLAHDQFVPVFHSLIQSHSIRDHLLIDVADYAHVANGPGIVLVAHEANFYLDDVDGRWGVTYSRKTPLAGGFIERLGACFHTVFDVAQLLEQDPRLGGIRFKTTETTLKINDRLYAPNTPETFAAVKPDLEKFTHDLFGPDISLEHRLDPKRLFEVGIKAPGASDLATLASRIADQKAVAAN
ncbi:MAG TPA: hypothetical protein VL282_10170 [Tepidisphaeraceae bacterium]|jgi:hypothetical protein|nr:hypothetical protein [Tepidisphaeraceae bacterium]